MRVNSYEFEIFASNVQATALNNTGVCLNPHLVREIWEKATDYDEAIDGILDLEKGIMDVWTEQELARIESKFANL